MEKIEKIATILQNYGFKQSCQSNDAVSNSEYCLSLALLKNHEQSSKLFAIRKIHFSNKWHDEFLTQVQTIVIGKDESLASAKQLALDVIQKYYSTLGNIEIKSEYIENLSPSIEILRNGTNLCSCGFLRDNIKNELQLNNLNVIVVSFILERF